MLPSLDRMLLVCPYSVGLDYPDLSSVLFLQSQLFRRSGCIFFRAKLGRLEYLWLVELHVSTSFIVVPYG